MRHRQRTLGEHVSRSLAVAGLLYAAALAYVVPLALTADRPADLDLSVPGGPSSYSRVLEHPAWRPALADRFPGCRDMASWTRTQVPRTVVAMDRAGDLARLPFDEAYAKATSPSEADDVWILGACR
jgi:hypothetical protein